MMRLPVEAYWARTGITGASAESLPRVTIASILLIQLPALSIAAEALRQTTRKSILHISAGLFMVLIVGSSFWSNIITISVEDSALLATTTLCAIVLFHRYSLKKALLLVFISFQIVLYTSARAANAGWGLERNAIDNSLTGVWNGIFTNRNFLAPVAGLATFVGVSIFIELIRSRKLFWALAVTPYILIDAHLLNMTNSGTMQGATWIYGTTYFTSVCFQIIMRRFTNRRKVIGTFFSLSMITAFTTWLIFVYARANETSKLFSRSAELSGRTEIWAAGWERVFDHPLLGWGWMSAWFASSFRTALPAEAASYYWSHSAHLDVALGTGFTGLFIYSIWIISMLFQSGKTLAEDWAPIRTALTITILVIISFESMSMGFHYLLAIIFALSWVGASKTDALAVD
jgi:O-antigen ligase